jgi:hypothetical protein
MRAFVTIGNLPVCGRAAIVLLLLAAGQPALAQESRGSSGYGPALLSPPMPSLDAEEAFRKGDRRRLKKPVCGKPDSPQNCQLATKYAEEYNRTLEALEKKSPQ